MILGVIGSRKYGAVYNGVTEAWDYRPGQKLVENTLVTLRESKVIDEVTSGGADGPDKWGESWARSVGIKCKIYVPRTWEKEYKTYAEAAFARNTKIAERCTILLSFWDGKSTGTLDTMKKAAKLGKKVYVVDAEGNLTRWSLPQKS